MGKHEKKKNRTIETEKRVQKDKKRKTTAVCAPQVHVQMVIHPTPVA